MAKIDTPNKDTDTNPYDFYVEPDWVWPAVFKHEKLFGGVLDPCCGTGRVLDAAAKAIGSDHRVTGADIVDRGHPRQLIIRDMNDVLLWKSEQSGAQYGCVVSNPPFYRGKGYEQFHLLARELAKFKIICIGNARLPYSGTRMTMFRDFRPSRIYHLDRPTMPPHHAIGELGDDAFDGGAIDYCVIVWDLTAPHRVTETYWLRKDGTLI